MTAARARSVVRAVAWRHLHNAIGNPSLLLPPLIFPLFFFVAFAGGLAPLGSAPGFGYFDQTAFIFVFVLLQSAAFGGVFIGVAVASDLETGVMRRVVVATPDRAPVLIGYGLAALLRVALSSVLLLGLSLAAGMRVGGDAVQLAGVLALGLVVNAAATLFAMGIAVRVPTTRSGPLMQVPIFLIMFLAPVYTDREHMSGWVRSVADVNPVTLPLETGRGLLAGAPANVILTFATALLATVALAAWALRGLRVADVARAHGE